MTDPRSHWENIYQTRQHDSVSWYAPHLAESLALISRLTADRNAASIDIGG